MRLSVKPIVTLAALAAAAPALAQFTPAPNPVSTPQTGQRTLAGGTGTVTSTGSITTTGSTVTVLMSGTGTQLNNDGTIQQTGTGRAIDNTVNNSSLTIVNTGNILTVNTDAVRINSANTSISLTNSGTIAVSGGGQALDLAAITTATNTVTNLAAGTLSAVGEDAVRPGQNGVVNNSGTITATPTVTAGVATGSDGIDLRTEKFVTVTNSGTITGRHGIATDGANVGPSSLTVINQAGGVIQAVNGSGLNVDANTALPSALTVTANVTNAFGATIKGGALAATLDADGDGVDIDGVLTLDNSGDILGLGAKGGANNAEGIAAGGGSITNNATGRIIGSTLLADAPNGDTSRAGNGILIDDSSGGNAVAATTITNAGLIEGKTGFGVKMIGTFADTVTNVAGGLIHGAGSGATIQTGGGNDVLTNRGAIVSDIGNAIDLEAGNDQLKIEGGAASITGNVSGGAGSNTATLNPGADNGFSYAGVLSSFDSVEVQSGTVTLSGVNTYAGHTVLSGGALKLDGANRISAASVLDLGGGALALANAGGANGQTFASLALTGNATIDLGGSSLTFNGLGAVGSGLGLTVLSFFNAASPDYAFRVSGDRTLSSDFLALIGATTINGFTAWSSFDGSYTNVLPTPIPAAWLLLASGLGFFGAAARRTRAQRSPT
jgi:hypothetical protein